MDITKWSINDLKNAIFDLNERRVPAGGNCDIEDYRKELRRRGESDKGYHED